MQNPFSNSRIEALTERVRVNTQQQLVRVTRERTLEIQSDIAASFGAAIPFRRWVDGTLGKPLEQAKLVTLTAFETLQIVIDATIEALIAASPYGPEKGGHYRDDHWLFVNGQRRDAFAEGVAVTVAPTDQIIIVNARPYARKIEGAARRGASRRDRRPGLSVQAPNGVYEITAREIARRFGHIASVRFTYRGLAGGSSGRFPAIEIEARA